MLSHGGFLFIWSLYQANAIRGSLVSLFSLIHDNIFGAPVSAATGTLVFVDSDGRLGTFTVDGPDQGEFSPKGLKPQPVPDAAKQAMLNLKVEALEATVAELRGQLKEQAAQIQKVSAQLQLNNSAARTVASDH
jgi:hypothetical protein